MGIRLLPRQVRFFDLFISHADNLAAVAAKLAEMVDQFDRLDERVREIQALEKHGDEIDREIERQLENAFLTPFDREDIHEFTLKLDDVVDIIQATAELLVIYDVREPTDEFRRLARILAEQGQELAQATRKLEAKSGLGPHLEAVHRLEHEADGLSRAATARLFRDRLDPLEVLKWRDLYREIEDAIDAGEDAAEAIERMLHKST
jgi:uncharacterized protein